MKFEIFGKNMLPENETDNILWFAGLFEGEGTITIEVDFDEKSKFGVRIRPLVELVISLRDANAVNEVIKKLFPYRWITYTNKEHNTVRFVLKRKEDIKQFLAKTVQYFKLPTTKRKVILLQKIIEILEYKGKYRSKFGRNEMKTLLELSIELKKLQKRIKLRDKSIERLVNILTQLQMGEPLAVPDCSPDDGCKPEPMGRTGEPPKGNPRPLGRGGGQIYIIQ